MKIHPQRWVSGVAAALTLALTLPSRLVAQGVTTGAIAGTVTDAQGQPVEGAQVQIINRSTGFTAGSNSRATGYYLVQGLETGGPYTVRVRRIGFQPVDRNDIRVNLSQTTRVDIQLTPQATQLAGVTINAAPAEISATNQGTKTTISDSVIQRLPTTTRNLTDFIRLTPQVSASGPGFSAGGMSNRMNNVQIDGATERDVFGLGSTGQPGGQVSAKAISIDAVKELQVLLAPFDVRQGNFGGLLLNAITKSGTNELHGSAFGFYRNQDYGRNVPVLRATKFDRTQGGFSLGGPIIKDKLHFFTANEWQTENSPVTGPFFNQPSGTGTQFGANAADVARFDSIMTNKYNFQPGTAGALNSPQPETNLFGRLDYQMNDVNRIVARLNFTNTTKENRTQNTRSGTQAIYSTNEHDLSHKKVAPVLQFFSNFKNGTANELFLGANWVRDRRRPATTFPQITVNTVPSNAQTRFIAGADQFSQGNELDQDTYELTDNFTIPWRSHTLVVGTRNEYVKLRNLFTQSSYGVWGFANFDSLSLGNANNYRRAFILSQGGNVYFNALQSAVYAQDQWQATQRFNLTLGLRADISNFLTDNSYALAIDTVYGHHETPKSKVQFSPRLGFNYDITGDQVNQLRGGVGLFVGTPPYVWMENAYVNNGRIITFLNCNTTGTPAPQFTGVGNLPETCRNGAGTKPIGDVNFLDKNLSFPQPLRANLGFDRVLTGNLVATVEGLYSKSLNQFFFVNRNVAGPVGTDAHGRVLYGTIAATGVATATRPASVIANGGTARFSTAIDVVNQNKDYSYNLTGQLQKRYSNGWEALVAYTYGHSYDVQSFTSSTHISNWQFGRTYAGRQEDPYTTVSLFDQPHKITALGTRTLNWGRHRGYATDFTLSYQGVSGAPHDYIYGGSGGRGDLNADGVQGNDLIYVPKDANDPNEIRFQTTNFTDPQGNRVSVSAADQAAAFEQFIKSSPCLRSHRGEILPRNSCSQPWSNNFDLNVRQQLPSIGGQSFAVQLDVFNFGNLLNKNWGQQRVTPQSGNSNVPLVTHVASSSAAAATAVPVVTYNPYTFDPQRSGHPQEYQVGNFASNFYRLQLSVRYSF
jgi:outer membrane receptor for ferrienterochelin and colicin